jgi:DNA repair protein RecO (recombination protein O)
LGHATDALIARINDYGESSAVTVLLTPERGTVRAVAKGARRLSNSFKGPLDRGVLYAVRIGLRPREGLSHLHSARVREAFPDLRRSPARFFPANLVLEVADDLMRENEPHPELFRLTVFTLKVLDRAPLDRLPLAVTFFLARCVALSGHVPETEHCVSCGRPIPAEERPLLSAALGGVLHPACGQGEPGARSTRPAVLGLLRNLWNRSSAEMLTVTPEPGVLKDLRSLLMDWLVHVLERRFRAAGPAEREFARR